MYNCKELLNLKVLSLYEGELLGSVDKLYFDKSLKKLSFLGLVGEDGTKWLIPIKSIYHIGPNAITIKNKQSIALEISNTTETNNPLNCKAYSIEGEYLGTITDISFNDKYFTTKIYLDNDKTQNVEDVTSCGRSTVIFSSNKVSSKSFVPKQVKPTITEVSILPISPPVEPKQAKFTDPNELLIGRRCLKDILNFNNELLVKANATITKRHIAQVKKFGKLKELMLFSD